MANLTTSTASISLSSFYAINSNGHYGTTVSTVGSNSAYITSNSAYASGAQAGMTVNGNLEVYGRAIIDGKDITKLMEKIEDRLAILMDPDPEKLEKYAALKKAYDHYKLMEKLIGEG